tara:strand:+ start:317 stop:727 length:411 start_codon:yes stop_codon:yes gene_type:complete
MLNKIMILCLGFALITNITFSQNLKKYTKKSSYKAASYYSISQDILKGKIKKGESLTKSESNALSRYVSGKRQNTKNIKHFITAIGKHQCFVPKKKAAFKAWPKKKDVGNWYTLDCKANSDKGTPDKKPTNKNSTK